MEVAYEVFKALKDAAQAKCSKQKSIVKHGTSQVMIVDRM